MKYNYIIIGLLSVVLITSCKSKKKIAESSNKKRIENVKISKNDEIITNKPAKKSSFQSSTIAYINEYKDIAMEEMRIYKIPASITLAQGILESRSGNSELTRKSNNHFGIKCHKGWNGQKVYHDDDKNDECFRVYKNPNNSFKDHSKFLANRKRYAKLFKLKKGDYVRWAKGLSTAGYATDRRYPAKLIAIIEKYNLHKYDRKVLGKKEKLPKKDKVENYVVVKGDTLYSISKKFGLSVDELMQLNNLSTNEISIGQTLVLNN
ncbi:glucosaminidase domain-containing protein [Lutibacter sp.]|uniref:glucosaminidase domain-containing protein n=1 Tax=Lutibacter sp. TaxID=1925666 RepID=UPI0025BF0BEA|nr:glucosaminidase domain-containing protein [Lutibacter sp.]MCF6181686.1 glucosaminidase domain-containing protein [Lutibacter sp.]